jgi:hypothetical protein
LGLRRGTHVIHESVECPRAPRVPYRRYFALRVPCTLLNEARKAAESEGVALNQLITLALAEKVSAIRTQEYFEERARRADRAKVSRILARVGQAIAPMKGDQLPPEFATGKAKFGGRKRGGKGGKRR